jgi:hypothetical protein
VDAFLNGASDPQKPEDQQHDKREYDPEPDVFFFFSWALGYVSFLSGASHTPKPVFLSFPAYHTGRS